MNGYIQTHYDKRPDKSIQDRRQSPLFPLRLFNNLIKSVLLCEYAVAGGTGIDLCSGKGGDLFKWKNVGIHHVTFVDHAKQSVEHSRKRYYRMKKPIFGARFIHANCFDPALTSPNGPLRSRVDIVSCQFALHYSWETEQHARSVLRNVSRTLTQGGIFVATIPDENTILRRALESKYFDRSIGYNKNEYTFGNQWYSVTFETDPFVSQYPFGRKYTFSLKDAVENCPEYLVNVDVLNTLAEDEGLECQSSITFLEYFESFRSRPEYSDLIRKARLEHGFSSMSIDQADVAMMYRIVVFKKV